MSRTALYIHHIENGAKMTEFAGWQMPVFYSGIREEHLAVRSACGIFDASHMGEIEITGKDAQSLCNWLLTNDAGGMEQGRVQYSLLCNGAGGILDDLMVYRFSRDRFVLCVNASNTKRDFEWVVCQSGKFDVCVRDISRELSLVSVQGEKSADALRSAGLNTELPARFSFLEFDYGGAAFISRTGYTGEDGFEIFLPWDCAPDLWTKLTASGGEFEATMCGLGCRDTLRLEMGYTLYGNEIDEDVNPFEAGLGRYVKMDKGDFCGRDALSDVLKSGARRTLCGICMVEPGIARNSHKLFYGGSEAGFVTSGTMSPSLGRPVGLAMIDTAVLEDAKKDGVEVQIRNKRRKAVITNPPFYKKDSPKQPNSQEELN